MIIRKPYAFLIKYFKTLHFILAAFTFLLGVYLSSIRTYFLEYYKEGVFNNVYGAFEANFNINPYLIFLISIIIVITFLILLKKKNKPLLYYYLYFLFMFIIISVITYGYIELSSLSTKQNIVSQDIKMIIDLMMITLFINYLWIIILIARGLGFKVKQFDFKKELEKLNISDKDREEIEIDIAIDGEDYRALINRFRRKFRYYYLENKTILSLIGIVFIGVFLTIFMYYYLFGNRTFYQRQKFNVYDLKTSVIKSYQVKKDPLERTIKEGYFYLIVSVLYENNTNNDIKISSDVFVKTNKWHPLYSRFDDYLSFIPSRGYKVNLVKAKSKIIYNYVFEFKDKEWDAGKIFKLKYLNNKQVVDKYRSVVLAPTKMKIKGSQIEKLNKLNYNNKSLLMDTIYKIKDIKIHNKPIKLIYNKGLENEYFDYIEIRYPLHQTLIEVTYDINFDKRFLMENDFELLSNYFKVIKVDKLTNNYKVLSSTNMDFIKRYQNRYYYVLNTKFNKGDKIMLLSRLGPKNKIIVINNKNNK